MKPLTDKFIAEQYPRLYRTALRITGDSHKAAEFAQEAVTRALQRMGQFNGRAQPTTWLHAILVNCIRDVFRRNRKRSTASLDDWIPVPLHDADPPVSERLSRREELLHLRETIQNLPDTLRPAFVMTILDGYSYRQASEILNVPVGTIASRVHEARQIVKTAMWNQFPEE